MESIPALRGIDTHDSKTTRVEVTQTRGQRKFQERENTSYA